MSRAPFEGRGLHYLQRLSTTVPSSLVLVHNHVQPTRRLGSRGFRAWLSAPDATHLEVCPCGWAPELGRHYRVSRAQKERTGMA